MGVLQSQVESLADGMTAKEIREDYPQLTVEDIQATLAYVADSLKESADAHIC